MLYSEKETYLVEFFQHMDKSEICLLPTDEDTVGIVASIQDPTQWTKWTDSSAKNDPPPDFYCDDLALMMAYGFNIPATCQQAQTRVKSTIENMTGLAVTDVNIRIAGITMPEA